MWFGYFCGLLFIIDLFSVIDRFVVFNRCIKLDVVFFLRLFIMFFMISIDLFLFR